MERDKARTSIRTWALLRAMAVYTMNTIEKTALPREEVLSVLDFIDSDEWEIIE